MFALIASWEGKLSEIFITARHLVNLAPRSKYSAHLSLSPSKPPVIFSSGEESSGLIPLSTLMPGNAPCSEIISFKGVPSFASCLKVSSNKITPPILFFIPSARKSISR